MFPYTEFEGIKIHDWSKWEDPFRLTVDAYTKYQAEKDKRLYAVLDGFAQSQGHLTLSEARYLNAMKIFLQGVTPLEYQAHRNFAFLARHLNGGGPRFAALCQSIDELRHTQTEIHTLSNYNKYYSGMHSFNTMHDRVWYLSVPKSYFDDALSAGPFEFLIAIGFSFEYLLTNLLFVPFMSGASFNGDLPSMTFGFSAQSDESRHMTLGLEAIKFLLEQDEANVPIVQAWIDKWFWRGYRLTSLVAAMLDYMLPRKVMSWKEAFELYFEKQMLEGLFPDLAYYGIKPPRHVEQAIEEKDILSHQVQWILYQFSFAASFTTTVPDAEEMDWLSEQYPDTFDRLFRPLWEKARKIQDERRPVLVPGPAAAVPDVPDPDGLHRTRRPDHDLPAQQRLRGRALQLLLGRLQVDLRPRAGEVRAGVVARAPDLPGQLRRSDRARTCWPGTASRTATAASTPSRATTSTGPTGTPELGVHTATVGG